MGTYYEQGDYKATITSQGFSDGDFGLQFVLKIQPKSTGDSKERTVFLALTNKEGGRDDYADKTIEVLRHLGFHGAEANFAKLDPESVDCHSFVNMEVDAYCHHGTRKSDGETVERWYINTPRSGGIEIVKPDSLATRKLDSLFGKELKAPPETPPPAQEAPPLTPAVAKQEAEALETAAAKDIPF